MKSLIVVYYPIRYGDTDAVSAKNKSYVEQNLEKLKASELHNDFHIMVIEDPNIEFVHTEVFFKPE